jgi:hypothetical protein
VGGWEAAHPHPEAGHASQQLGAAPTHALPPLGGVHAAAPLLTLHVVLPSAVVRQQVTKPNLPQVDCAAQVLTASTQLGGRLGLVPLDIAWTTPMTHFI